MATMVGRILSVDNFTWESSWGLSFFVGEVNGTILLLKRFMRKGEICHVP